ncbi:MAG TPA: hypothetical protein VH639_16260 [Bryobacteraceae bacterium]|jgi:hypothetical protein
MADIQITDRLDKPIETIHIDLSQPSSLFKYLKTSLLHLAVIPDFLARKDLIISQAATKPVQFQATVTHGFQLGNTNPGIEIAPAAQATIGVNASPGANLFDSDPFNAPAIVPDRAGYVSVGFQGSLNVDAFGSAGNFSFGFDKNSGVSLEFSKAFPLGEGEPTLGGALGAAMSRFAIPADLSDLDSLAIGDVATVSGQGSLTVSGGVRISMAPNPLASVDLPLGAGAISVNPGAVAGLNAHFTISGNYQVRTRRKDADTIELSFFRERGTTLTADFSASAGVTASHSSAPIDLVALLLNAISKDPMGDSKLLADLKPDEIGTLAGAIKGGLDRSLHASLDATLSNMTDDQAAFQYEIQSAKLSAEASAAVRKALNGDLSLLTAMEDRMKTGGDLAPGVKMLNSVLTETRQRGATLKINLLGIVNFLSVSELIRNSEVVADDVTGDVTIKETVTGNRINAITDPLARQEALRKVMFDSVLATTSYRAGRAIALPELSCSQVHFALNRNTNRQIAADYLRWFIALDLLTEDEKAAILAKFVEGGPSTCVLRTSFGDADCDAMFFDANGALRRKPHYLEIGRQAMRAVLDPDQPIDRLRLQILQDAIWPQAVAIGANVNLGPLVGLRTDDIRVMNLIGDVKVISDWAEAMIQAGVLIQDMRSFVGASDPTALIQNSDFKKKRDALQKKLSAMIKASTTRFAEPWGMVSLFQAGGSPQSAHAKAVTQRLTLERGSRSALAAGKG